MTTLVGITQDAARRRLQERLDRAPPILEPSASSTPESGNPESQEIEWFLSNRELLLTIFNDDEYARGYVESRTFDFDEEVYFVSSVEERAQLLNKSIIKQKQFLQIVLSNLVAINEENRSIDVLGRDLASAQAINAILDMLQEIRAALPTMALSNAAKAEIHADISQIAIEAERPTPRRRFLILYLESLRDNLARAAGAGTAAALAAAVGTLLAKYFGVF